MLHNFTTIHQTSFDQSLTKLILLLLLISLSEIGFTQTYQLMEIINSSIDAEEKEDQFILFFKEHKNAPTDSLADSHHNLARRWYFVQSKKPESSDLLRKAIEHTAIAVELKSNIDSLPVVSLQSSLLNLSIFLRNDGQSVKAINSFKKLIALDLVNRKTLIAYRQMSECYLEIGDLYNAKSTITNAIRINKSPILDLEQLSLAHYNLALAFSEFGYRDNEYQIAKNLDIADSLALVGIQNPSRQERIRNTISHLKGNLMLKTEHFDLAYEIIKNSIGGFNPLDSVSLAIALNSLGNTALKLSNFEEAMKLFDQSISYDLFYSAPYENIGDYYLQKNQVEKALQNYQNAIDISIGNPNFAGFDQELNWEYIRTAPDKTSLLSHLSQKSNGWLSLYQEDSKLAYLEHALSTLKMADQLLDEIRLYSYEEQSKLFWQEKSSDIYIKAVEICEMLQRPEEAFYFLEKNKAILLIADLMTEKARVKSNLPSSFTDQEDEFKKEIRSLESTLKVKRDNQKNSDLLNKIDSLKDQLNKLRDEINLTHPTYAKSSQQIQLKSLSEIKSEYLNDHTVILQYMMNNEQGFGLFHSNKSSELFQINKTADLQEDLDSYLQKVKLPIFETQKFEELLQLSNTLFTQLIPSKILTEIQDKKIIIIADHTLQQLPFETLCKNKENGRFLIQENEIQYAYSLSHLSLNSDAQRNPITEFTGFAPYQFEHSELNDLFWSKKEVKSIGEFYSSNLYLDKDATKANFIETCKDGKIIHLSTHSDADKETSPWIAFRKEKIHLDEIYSLENQSELVVLSSCNSSIGEIKGGEGVLSLARAFFFAGSNAVMASLWPSNDKANKEIMVDFYKYLSEGLNKSTALKNAKINYLNSHQGSELAPSYWGGTILIGNNKPLPKSSFWNVLSYSLTFLILTFLSFTFWTNRKKKPRV